MIYFIKDPPKKDGEWKILEAFNMSVVATVYHERLAERIVKLLNDEDEEISRQHNVERFCPEI